MCLPPAYSWTKKGRSNRHEVRSRWGKQGRINLIGPLSLDEEVESLEYRILEGSCRTGEVLGSLDSLTQEAERKGRRVVVVLDNAPFHKAGAVRDARPGWEAKGLELYYLPAYCPHLNLIEGVWKRLKGFLMLRISCTMVAGGARIGLTRLGAGLRCLGWDTSAAPQHRTAAARDRSVA